MLAFAGGDAAGGRPVPESLTAFTERTITDPAALAAELDRSAPAGGPRPSASARPISPRWRRRRSVVCGELAAILGVPGPVSRLPLAARRTLREPLLAAAAELSLALGGSAGG